MLTRREAVIAVLVAGSAMVVVATRRLTAGPLSPPAGPVASTYKTLTEVEPRTVLSAATTPGSSFAVYRITQPGSYYLAGNVTVPAGVLWGVSIESPRVTLDLNGFTIDAAGIGGGVSVGNQAGVTVRNGTITDSVFSGVSCGVVPVGSPGMMVENIRVVNVLTDTVTVGALGNVSGISLGRESSAVNCTVVNAPVGITTGYGSRVVGCTVNAARSIGFDLFDGSIAEGCTITGTTAQAANSGMGFYLRNGTMATGCAARSNAGAGFVAITESTIRGCSSSNNSGGGYVLGNRSMLVDCSATQNSGVAIDAGGNCTITNALVTGGSTGVRLVNGGNRLERSKIGNAVAGVTSDGIDVIVENSLNSSGAGVGDGISITGDDTVVDGNAIYGFSRGVASTATFVSVTRNRFHLITGVPTFGGGGMVAPTVSTAAGLTNPLANTAQ